MKINLPLNVISDCLKNSEVFRDYVARIIFGQCIDKAEIEDVFLPFMKSNRKIAAIKALLEYSRNNKDRISAIKYYYPDCFESFRFYDDHTLGLASSKKIVELYA